MKKSIVIMGIISMIGCIISISGSYAATSYAISANKIAYSDNSNLGVNNVQAAIDGTCTKFSSQLTSLTNNVISKIYPVGSIYMSTTDSTVESVAERFGGTWEKYAEGTMLVSANSQYKINTKGGSSTVTLSKANIPSISVTGTTDSTGNGYSIGYTSSMRTTATGNATSYRRVTGVGDQSAGNHSVGYGPGNPFFDYNDTNYPMSGHTHNYSDYYANSISGVAAHTHTFTGNYTNVSPIGISVQNPYTAVYMYKRVK